MRSAPIALTGPAAAALFGWDGFRDQEWPLLWCTPAWAGARTGVIRSRRWAEPAFVGGQLLAHASVVLHHLGLGEPATFRRADGVTKQDRIELAVEHALREGAIELGDLATQGGSGTPELTVIARLRGTEPPTDSYAETRAVQLLRQAGIVAWRQVVILEAGRILQRADLVAPYRRMRRPRVVLPAHGLLIEVDGRGPHEPQFEADHRRQTNYDRLGYRWTSFTPTQIEREPLVVLRTLETLLGRGYTVRT
jgi:hypothetical protein